jgi:hypothetical protein
MVVPAEVKFALARWFTGLEVDWRLAAPGAGARPSRATDVTAGGPGDLLEAGSATCLRRVTREEIAVRLPNLMQWPLAPGPGLEPDRGTGAGSSPGPV